MNLANLNIFKNQSFKRKLNLHLVIFIFGIFSGIPISLTLSTLKIWFMEYGMSLSIIGMFSSLSLPYGLKFLWAPLIDNLEIKYLTTKLGKRRAWMLLALIAASISCLIMSQLCPTSYLSSIFCSGLLYTFCAASFDIAFEAFRIESFNKQEQTLASSSSAFGFRLGILLAGGYALILAEKYNWQLVYMFFGLSYIIAIINLIYFAKEPKVKRNIIKRKFNIQDNIIEPFKNYMQKPFWWQILLIITLYKIGETFLTAMTNPFLMQLGFSKSEIAYVSQFLGFGALLIGSYLGGIISFYKGHYKSLYVCGLLQVISNISFIILNYYGPKLNLLTIAITLENITGGMATAVLVGFLSSLCDRRFTATQYTLLSSIAALSRNLIVPSSGWMVEYFNWNGFFIITSLIALPALTLIKYIEIKDLKSNC